MSRSMCCLAAVMLAVAAGTAEAVTIRVPNDQPTIQAGVSAAAFGDTVLVSSGYYVENILMKDGVALVGTGTAMPVINSASGWSVVDCPRGVFGPETRIEGFRLGGATAGPWASGVRCDDGSATVRYNVIRDTNMGVLLKESHGHAVIDHNTIISNYDCGIELYNGDDPEPSGTSLISNNIITGNANFGIYRAGVGCPLPLEPHVNYNDVWGNGENYWDVPAGARDISADPLFCEPGIGNYFLDSWSPCVGAGWMGTDIGALRVGCGATVVEPTSWGAIKAMYR